MGAFNPITPRKAVELASAAHLADAETVLVDFAVAGLIRAYARVIETTNAEGARSEVRDSRIPRDLWRRIRDEGAAVAIWSSGSVSLAASDLDGGEFAVSIIGIRFDDKSLGSVIAAHGGDVEPIAALAFSVARSSPARPPAPVLAVETPSTQPERTPIADQEKRTPTGIPDGAITVTVSQAVAALGLGRTTVDKLMRSGTLVRLKVGSRTLITTDSIRALIDRIT